MCCLPHRGRCDPAIPGNAGKMMRSHIVRKLREASGAAAAAAAAAGAAASTSGAAALEANVCCNGREAGDEVRLIRPPALRLPGCAQLVLFNLQYWDGRDLHGSNEASLILYGIPPK